MAEATEVTVAPGAVLLEWWWSPRYGARSVLDLCYAKNVSFRVSVPALANCQASREPAHRQLQWWASPFKPAQLILSRVHCSINISIPAQAVTFLNKQLELLKQIW